MKTIKEVLLAINKLKNPEGQKRQEYFGIGNIDSCGLTQPQIKSIAKQAGKNHALALELWKTGVHEAKHIAVMIADKNLVTEKLMDKWLKDFNSWDMVDGCCGTLFDKTPFAYDKAKEWSGRKKEFEKRAGFSMMAMLAVHDKKANDEKFIEFFPYLLKESDDDRNFVKKAVNWAIRQIGKRNERLCKKAIKLSEDIKVKNDSASLWIAADALRELKKYLAEGKIKNTGNAK
jgi:3-methyladenine DNA glycosylase AlkD